MGSFRVALARTASEIASFSAPRALSPSSSAAARTLDDDGAQPASDRRPGPADASRHWQRRPGAPLGGCGGASFKGAAYATARRGGSRGRKGGGKAIIY